MALPPAATDPRGRQRRRELLCAALALAWLGPRGPLISEPTGYKVIVNAANPVASVTREYVSRLFLKKISRWDDGTPANPVDLTETDPVREDFSRAVHKREARAVKAYWQQMIFSGRAAPPPEVAWEADVLAFVRANRGAIGYVSRGATPEGVKVLELTER